MSKMIGAPNPVVGVNESTDILVSADAVVYTRAFKIGGGGAFGIWARAKSDIGDVDIKIELEQGYKLPDPEGSADLYNWNEPDKYKDIFTQINDEFCHMDVVHPIPMPFGRYRITGNVNNPIDTIVNIVNFVQEQT